MVPLKGKTFRGKLIKDAEGVIVIATKSGDKLHFSKRFVDILERNPIKLKVKE